ncbi:glycosyltransferase [Clostridium transplantifaecale]|uniref:glycosyltransferase n=1 Tax=Clostridium transplantifaecale TaxID=2479838 RepID=UPI0013DE7164|nr:glycosyltransferase [Clostridium transplantifaecale]
MNEVIVNVALVTYNRWNCLSKLLDALEKQTKKINSIIIVDNHSSDGTMNNLHERGAVDIVGDDETSVKECKGIRYIYYYNKENEGGSGGFYKAIDIATGWECDYLWIMDDDVLPETDCLEKLLGSMKPEIQAVIPNRTDKNFDDRVCTKLDMKSTLKFSVMKRKTFEPHPLRNSLYIVEDIPFEGPLVSFEIVKKVGLPHKDFFILCDDTDYAIRIRKHTRIGFVTDATLHRQLAKKGGTGNKVFTWRDYYAIRNNILLERMYGESFGAKYISPIIGYCWWLLLSIYKRRFKNLRILNMAYKDGLKGISGKVVNPGDFK